MKSGGIQLNKLVLSEEDIEFLSGEDLDVSGLLFEAS